MSDNIIEVRDLVKVYNGNVRAMDGISFHVARGEVFGFLGPNGAGKSTTIKVLTTLLQKTAGNVTVDGMTLEKDAAAIRKIIGCAELLTLSPVVAEVRSLAVAAKERGRGIGTMLVLELRRRARLEGFARFPGRDPL